MNVLSASIMTLNAKINERVGGEKNRDALEKDRNGKGPTGDGLFG